MVKKLSLISLFTLLPASFYFAQTTVYAYVKDDLGKPVERATIDLQESDDDVIADKIGYFQFVDMKAGTYHITVAKPGFETRVIDFDVSPDEKRKDLGVISMIPLSGSSDAGVIVIDESASDDDGGSMQPTVGLLNAGRDAFQNAAAFELGAYWFRPRGVDNRYEDVLFNGVSMSKNDDGRVDFSNWGGLNDVTRYPLESVDNITPSEYAFGNLGGVVYYNTRASSYRKGTSLTYSATNRSYNHRLIATYSTGLMSNGWAFTFSGGRRWAEKGKIDGTYNDSYSYFGAIEKKFGDRFSINLTAFGSPTRRATNSPNTQEIYDLMGKNYNSYWGWQDGEMRSSRVKNIFEPVFQLGFYNKLGKTSNWSNTFSYQFGSDARSRLDWYHAEDPHPYYYRKLPSYFYSLYENELAIQDHTNPAYIAARQFVDNIANAWHTDTNTSQIDWMGLYNKNFNAPTETFSYVDAAGKTISVQGKRALYDLVEDVNKDKTFNFVSHFDTKLQDNWKLNLNFAYQNLRSDNFRRVKDLLGADFALNLDNFNNGGFYNMDNPNPLVREGDRTQFSYDLLRDSYNFNASTEVDFAKWNVVGSVFGSYSESQRDGHFRHHLFQNSSKGKSEKYTAFDAGLKGKVTYKINGKNFLVYNGAFFSLAPTLNEIFVNPRVTSFVTPGIKNQVINSNDLSFITRGQVLKLRVTGYYTSIANATEISRYYADIVQGTATNGNALIAEVLSGINKSYFGGELGADVKITPTINAIAVASVGEYKITNNPQVYSYDDLNQLRSWGEGKLKNYKVAGTPQKAFSLGLKYNSPKFWWVGASANYLMDQFLDFSALNRTQQFYMNPLTNDPYINPQTNAPVTQDEAAALLTQKKFDDQFMLNANAGKSFLFGKYRVGISVSVNNILNNRNYVTGGFEQGRAANFIEAQADANRALPLFGPKLWYDRGRTYFTNVYFRF